MAAALTVLLIGCLLQTALCGQFKTIIPQTIKVLSGSCVTIPCSFDVEDQYISRIDGTCRAMWKSDEQTVVFDSSNPQSSAIQGELKGDLTRRDCSTTLNNMRPEHSKEYLLRVQCDVFKHSFRDQKLHISVTDDPPTPTLTPSTLKVEEGTSVSLKCSAPAPCLSHPPALTWTSSLVHIQESLQENLDRTKVQTSVLTFTASRLHHGKIISCTAVYNKQDGSSQSVSTSLTADVSLSSQFIILPQTIEVLSGSCVTIPCSFDVEDTYKSNVDETCRAVWKNDQGTVVFNSRDPQTTGHLTGKLTNRDCTTTLNNMRPENSMKYFFGLECDNGLKYDFKTGQMDISVKDDPPTPTLTPSTLKVEEGASVSLKCSAPAPCLSHPPALTWTSSLGHIQDSLQENQDRTKVQTSVLNFTASRLHHGKIISCTAVYNKQDGSSQSVSSSLTADVSWSSQFIAFMPQTIEVLSGSCVTIPCSFGVEDTYKSNVDKTCRAVWKNDQGTVVFDSRDPQTTGHLTGHLTGNLTNRDCTTTLNNMRPENSMKYFFGLECDNGLEYDFKTRHMDISVKDDPPTPTLTPSTLKVEEGTSVSLKCSAPAPCLSHPPALTWTSSLGHIQDSLQENHDRTKVQTSVLTFTASRLHHGKIISCTAVYNKQDGSSQSVSTSLTADVSLSSQFITFMPQTIEVLSGSCVTIPCSFGVEDKYKTKEDETCRAVWKSDQGTVVFNSRNPQTTGHLTGNLTNRDCTTTLNNMRPENSMKYFFRLECDGVKYDFLEKQVDISVKDDPPTPTLTPSTLKVEEGTSVSLKCSAPAPCLSHPPALTWTSSLGYIQDSLQENLDRTKVQTSILNFTASRLHHGQIISCTAVYNKQDGSSQSVSTSLTADVSYSPKHTTVSVSPSGPVPENSIVTLTCSSTANPAVRSYTWYRADGGQETVMGTGHVLNIKASRDIGPFFCEAENAIGSGRSNISQIDVHTLELYLGPYSGLLLLAGAAVSLCVNVLLTIYVVILCKARKSVKPKEEDRTYMSLERRDLSPEYDVIGHTPK
ncbi:B-cell receptor CD22-like isoform X2 [Acanthopagrus latus]|uniref:B-cell receptor CD22-like isoform X2 n=1 Tax=Acanthopagrus latus TaxID=8177 RepID=UPI00187CD965|nr:B-cell receptor CD22-like isoform X2 [Acanthopagrus latus]